MLRRLRAPQVRATRNFPNVSHIVSPRRASRGLNSSMRRRDRSIVVGEEPVPAGRSRWGRPHVAPANDAESLVDSFDDSAARANWADRLGRYVDQQGAM